MSLLITGRELDIRIDGDRIVDVAHQLRPGPRDEIIDAAGGTVIPGLHDHHVHLHALAARRGSLAIDAHDAAGFAALLGAAPPRGDGWIRAVGYHESVAGLLDASALDAIVADRPVRVQHRSGGLWILNGTALRAIGAARGAHPGIERDARGRPTGRLWRADDWLRTVLPAEDPDLSDVGAELAALGVTGLTDADPLRPPGSLDHLRRLPQHVHVMGPPELRLDAGDRLAMGAVKVILDDDALPGLADLAACVSGARAEQRPIAIHCVTRAQLLLALAALDEAGASPGDRIEHAAVVPGEVIADIRRLGLVVVVQPNFVSERGDGYLLDVEPDDVPYLYRTRSLIDAGIPVAAGTDAPFGRPDPWAAIGAAIERRTPSGAVLGPDERLDPRRALGLFLGTPEAPGTARTLTPGEVADICILRVPLADALRHPSSDLVATTIIGGTVAHQS